MAAPKKPVPSLAVSLHRAHDWCEAALFQGRRLSELLDYHLTFDRRNAMPAEWRAFRAANVLPSGAQVETLEGYVFLVALYRVVAELPHLARRGQKAPPEMLAAAKTFLAAVPKAAQLKKLLDHEHDGLLGGGKSAAFYELSPEGVAASLDVAAAKGDYLLGGEVSLPAAMAALESLAKVLASARPR